MLSGNAGLLVTSLPAISRVNAGSEAGAWYMLIILFQLVSLLVVTDAAPELKFQEEKIYTVSDVAVKPEPVMGLKEFQARWSKKVAYPKEAIKKNVQGMVFIEFIVDKDGTIHEAAVKSGIGFGCDEAALIAFEELSKEGWKPGIKKDQPVKVKMVLPFFYRIIQK